MLRAKKIHELLFDWAKDWRKGFAPARLDNLYAWMLVHQDYSALCAAVVNDLQQTSHSQRDPSTLNLYHIGAVLAALGVLHSPDTESDRNSLLYILESALNDRADYAIQFYQGCVVGLLLWAVSLYELNDKRVELEEKVWPLVFQAAEKADLHPDRVANTYVAQGKLTNLLADYCRPEFRRMYLRLAVLVDLGLVLQSYPEGSLEYFPHDGLMRTMARMVCFTFFKNSSDDEKLAMVTHHLTKRKL